MTERAMENRWMRIAITLAASLALASGTALAAEEAAQEIILHLEREGFIGVSPEPASSTGA